MRTLNKKQVLVGILAITVLASLMLAPSAKAMNITYSNTFFTYLTITGPDQTRPGNTETYTISGSLGSNMSGSVRLRLWLYTNTQTLRILIDTDVLATGNYLAGSFFIKSYPIIIPSDADNNKYVYAQIDAGTSRLTNLTVTLVQNPTYSELQTQVSQLQTQVNNLTTQLSTLQNQLNTLQANNTNLQNQVGNLTIEKAALQLQVNNLQGNNSALQAQLSILNGSSTELQSQLATLQTEKTALQAQVNSLQTEKSSLQAQVNDLQANNTELGSQVVGLQSDKASLQILVNNLDGNNTELLNQTNNLQAQVNNLQLNCTNLQAIVDTFSLQIASLKLQASELESQNSTNTILMYLATGVAAAFIAVTGYFLFMVLRKKKTSEETPLY